MILQPEHIKAIKILAKDMIKMSKLVPWAEFLELDCDNSIIRLSNGYNILELKDWLIFDDWGTNMKTRLWGIEWIIYIPVSSIILLPDVSHIYIKEYVNELTWWKTEFMYIHSSFENLYTIIDRFKAGKWSIELDYNKTMWKISETNLFWEVRTPTLMYSEEKVKFDKMLKILWKWEYEIAKDYTKSEWDCSWLLYSLICSTSRSKSDE